MQSEEAQVSDFHILRGLCAVLDGSRLPPETPLPASPEPVPAAEEAPDPQNPDPDPEDESRAFRLPGEGMLIDLKRQLTCPSCRGKMGTLSKRVWMCIDCGYREER